MKLSTSNFQKLNSNVTTPNKGKNGFSPFKKPQKNTSFAIYNNRIHLKTPNLKLTNKRK